jgi:hypothetical protein
MPDIRALLEDVTTRGPHPDPVGAVHATVRRRARRRTTAVAVGATAAVAAAALTAAARPFDHAEPATPTPSPSTSPSPWTRFDTSWRRPRIGAGVVQRMETTTRLGLLVDEHPDVFFGFTLRDESFTIGLSADADPGAWADDVRAVLGDAAWTWRRCPETVSRYDEIATNLLSVDWPSGDALREDRVLGRDGVGAARLCQVEAEMTRAEPAQEDEDYARQRWGGAVALVGRKP